MKVICAWCHAEDGCGYLGEEEPLDDPSLTHGVCFWHREQFLESLPSTSFPDAEMLIVVRPNDTALYEYLQRRLAGVKGVKVILDRRRESRPVGDERQHQERRIRQGKIALGYTLFRFKRKPPSKGGSDRVEL